MEDRLPPGDILLGGVLGGSWLPPAISRLNAAAQPLNALGSQAETRLVDVQQSKPESFYAAASQDAFILSFTVARNQAPHGTTGSPADPARPVNSTRIQPAFRDASGLDDGALDRLLGDDFDQLSSSTAKSGANRGTRGITGSLDPAETIPAGGGPVSGSFPSIGQGLQGPSTPFVPDAQTGGLMGGGGGGSAQIPAGSGSTPANLITGGHFATLGNQHGVIRPYTSGAAWPSYTPPSSGGSGGGPPVDTVNSGSGGSNGGASGGINNSNNGTNYVNDLTSTGLESLSNISNLTTTGNSSGSSSTAEANTTDTSTLTNLATLVSGTTTSDVSAVADGTSTVANNSGSDTSIISDTNGASSGSDTNPGGGAASAPGNSCNCSCSPGLRSTAVTTSTASPDYMIENAPGVADHSISGASEYSPAGVRYFDGQINITNTDLSTNGFGSFWSQTRSWSNGTPPSSFNGTGMIDVDRPYLLRPNGDNSQIVVVSNATDARFFDLVGSNYVPQFFVQDQLTHNTSTGEFLLTDTVGDTLHFWDWTASQANEQGQFKSCTDADGNTIAVTSYTSDGKVSEMQRSDGTTTQSYLYTYLASPDPNAGLISNVTLRQKVNSGSWTVVRQVAYDYYDGTSHMPFGNLGDLRTATTLDGNNNVIDKTYYRYYTPKDAGNIGYVHGLKYSFSPQSYARMAADISNPLMATDSQVAPYADDYYQYVPATQQVSEAVIQGSGCSVCTGGQGTFTYSYGTSTFSNSYNNWETKTVETLPDGSTNTVYANFAGETMLNVFQSGSQKWENFYEYDGSGRQVLQANPSAVTGYNDAYADLLDMSQVGDYGYLSLNNGLIQITDYYPSTTATETTAGGAAGYFEDSQLKLGKSGIPILQQSVQYFEHSAGGMTVFPQATSTVYRNTNGTGAETTSYSYTWFTGTTQKQSMTLHLPVITSAENGPGSADVWTYTYDQFERVVQTTDPDGFVNTYQFDQATGAQTQIVVDSGTGHLNLTTTTVVDALGRPLKVTDPNGNVAYTLYNDANHEVRVYRGWTGTLTTGPTQVTREDRTHDPSYTETLTMSATPHVTNGQPDGTEAYAFFQSLSRTITSKGGHVQESDNYFNLGGVPYSTNTYLGTAGVNYYATQYTYDNPRGWLSRVLSPTGTITRTVYDPLGRVVSTWIGTNDTPASGSWSPTNNTAPSNMVQVTGNVWDGGAIGDSTLTQVTQYPGGSAPARVTQDFYGWRDRLVASKQGVQASENDGTGRPIFYSVYDNLSEIITSQRYDGDGVTITSTNGVPNAPSASLMQAQTTTEFDDQGRVYQSNVYWVEQGSVSTNTLTTNKFYNHRGLVVQVTPPGAASTKTSYDGAGRPTVLYTADAILDTTWANAITVNGNDDVLTQTETTYDNDGNPILVTRRDHFDTDSMPGPLGNPTTAPFARVYYTASYYDAASRLTASVNVGTNGGSAYTRPSTVPARSDTVLVTSTGYQADAVQQVVLTGSPTGGSFTLTFGGQATAAIAYNSSAATVQADLQALSTIGSGNVLVSGPSGGPWQVRFAVALAGIPEVEMVGNGSGLTGGTQPSVAVGTTSQGWDTGRVQSSTDPRGLISKTDYDLMGRTLRTIQNFVAFAPSNSADQTTQYSYDGGNHILTLSAVLPGYVLETTSYTYGVTGSPINSNDLLASVTYPANGQGNTESYTYNGLGETVTHNDRDGNTHTYSYDILGRQTADAVTTLGAGVDGSVRMLTTAYDSAGHPYLYTSYADTTGTTIVNQVEQVYDGLNDVSVEYQSHGGAVNARTTPKVEYQYSFNTISGNPNNNRLTAIVYPDGNTLNYYYNRGTDDDISRLSSLGLGSSTSYYVSFAESYTYLGLNTIVERFRTLSSSTLQMSLDVYGGVWGGGSPDGGDQYTGLDRFGRVYEVEWMNNNTNQPTDNTIYSYDRDGNVLTRSQQFFSTEQFGYDGLNQLTSYTKGGHTQSWSLDAVGNWSSFTNDGSTQTRSFNNQNQLTSISGATTPTYDNNGNTTRDDTGNSYTYDAWNRIVKVVSGSNTEMYSYDALGRRITTKLNSTTPTDLYFSTSWQVLEEDQAGTVQYHNVWGLDYVDDLVARTTPAAGYYVEQEANWNVTSLADTTGTVQEYYSYDPYGKATFYRNGLTQFSSSAFGMVYLFQGGRLDPITGLYNFRHRDISPTLGRWMQEDPAGFKAGDSNFYGFQSENPSISTDPQGEWITLFTALLGAAIGGSVGYYVTHNWRGAVAGAAGGFVSGLTLGLAGPAISTAVGGGLTGGFLTGAATGLTGDLTSQAVGNYSGSQCGYNWQQTAWNVGVSSIGGGLIFRPATLTSQPVVHWGGPVVRNNWVQVGNPNLLNYFLSGAWVKYPFSSASSGIVRSEFLEWPAGAQAMKGFIGQRIYTGP